MVITRIMTCNTGRDILGRGIRQAEQVKVQPVFI